MSTEEKLLRFNNYLPSHLQTNDIDKLLEMIGVVLQTNFVINNISKNTFSDNQTFVSLLPEDVHNEIIDNSHPYYLTNYCSVNKDFQKLCQVRLYHMLKRWCFPSLTINEIKEILPSPSMNDVIILSLVYSPIPESVKYWDKVTLFYYACVNQYPNPDDYLIFEGNKPENILNMDIIPWICYKFNRLDILEKAIRNGSVRHTINGEIFESAPQRLGSMNESYGQFLIYLIKLKLGIDVSPFPQNYESQIVGNFQHELSTFIPRLMNTLLNYEEIIDLILFAKSYRGTDRTYMYDTLINGYINGYSDVTRVCVVHCAKMIGKERVQQLMNKYNLTDQINYDYNNGLSLDNYDYQYRILHRQSHLEKHDSVEDLPIIDSKKAIYFLTSGNFPKYLKYLSLLEGDTRLLITSSYTQLNMFGGISFDFNTLRNIEKASFMQYRNFYEYLDKNFSL